MRYYAVIIAENDYAVNPPKDIHSSWVFNGIESARTFLGNQLAMLSNEENQAHSTLIKDAFCYFIKEEGKDYANKKRAIFITPIYKNALWRYRDEAKQKIRKLFNHNEDKTIYF